jgi:hypothetical protein
VVLEWDGCRAVVRADYRERRVDIHVIGPEMRRRELLAVIREKFEEQHGDLKGMTVDERVLIPNEPGVTVGYRDLLQRELDGEEEFRPEGAKGKVRVAELLNGVESAEYREARRKKDAEFKKVEIVVQDGGHVHLDGDTMEKNIQNISGGTFYGPVAVKMEHCLNLIGQQPAGEKKRLLESLQTEAGQMIKALPPNQQEKAAGKLEVLVNQAVANEPEREWYSLSAKGLLEASQFAKDFTGNIVGTVGQLGKLLWPDFKLPE